MGSRLEYLRIHATHLTCCFSLRYIRGEDDSSEGGEATEEGKVASGGDRIINIIPAVGIISCVIL